MIHLFLMVVKVQDSIPTRKREHHLVLPFRQDLSKGLTSNLRWSKSRARFPYSTYRYNALTCAHLAASAATVPMEPSSQGRVQSTTISWPLV